ncbi:MAG: hypothetical protein C5S45_00520 [Candidatus Methanocomedens sp.]|nr:MAG: hypothetical protein C5S45_00520 [ANME-2 cluster archaeon]
MSNYRYDIKEIERQFADALFVMGRRINEVRSPEWAFMQTAQTMKGTGIGEAFQDGEQNISFLRTTLAGAIFDQEYGAFRNIYSEQVHTTMRLFTEYKSHEAAGVIILVRFAGGIEYGGDKAQFMYELGKGLPLSILVFTISMVVSRTLFASIV